MTDNKQDRSRDKGQQGSDRETERRNRENETGRQQGGPPGEGGFVGSNPDQSSDYLTKGEEDQDFAAEGQGAQETSAGRSDVETGQPQDRDSSLDDGSDSNR